MKGLMRFACFIGALLLIFSGCSTMTTIHSEPPGAELKINNTPYGTTPVTLDLSDAIWESYRIELSKEGYETLYTSLDQEVKVGTVIGGLFVWPLFLWSHGPRDHQLFILQEK